MLFNIILNQEMNKKHKKEEMDNFIYKVNDFDAIQNRIDYFERQVKRNEKELQKVRKFSKLSEKVKIMAFCVFLHKGLDTKKYTFYKS